jgi:hypothetical protein
MFDVLGVEVELREHVTIGSLRLYPLITKQTTSPPYLTGPEASRIGAMKISELDPPEVAFLKVTNVADVPILLVEGETLVGGDQDRTMNVTVLCPPEEETIVPVSCVEAGRWGARRPMASPGRHAPGSLRSAKIRNLEPRSDVSYERGSDQGRVWDEVDRQTVNYGIDSPTSALEDVYIEAQSRIADALDALAPLPDQTGVICAIDGEVVGMDLFDRPETLRQYLRGIVAGHALDASDPPSGADPIRAIERFFAQVDAAECDTGTGVGLGEEILLRGDVSGVGLTFDGTLVHIAAFPFGEDAAVG